MLKSKCILEKKEPEDGKRISIMSRHTLNDGVSPDKRITEKSYDEHYTKFAPSPKLVGKHYRGEITFDDFKKEYLEYLSSIENEIIQTLVLPATESNITVMCIEKEPENCHRKILIEYSTYLANILKIELETKIE